MKKKMFAYLYRRKLGAIGADLFSAFATCSQRNNKVLDTPGEKSSISSNFFSDEIS